MRVEKHIINFDQSFCTGSNHYYLAENKIVIMDSPGSALVAILYIKKKKRKKKKKDKEKKKKEEKEKKKQGH